MKWTAKIVVARVGNRAILLNVDRAILLSTETPCESGQEKNVELTKEIRQARTLLQNAAGLDGIRGQINRIQNIERLALRRAGEVKIFVSPERGFYVRTNNEFEYGAHTDALRRLARAGAGGAPYIRVSGSYGSSHRLFAWQVDLPRLQNMLENYVEWNRRDIAARNRLQIYG